MNTPYIKIINGKPENVWHSNYDAFFKETNIKLSYPCELLVGDLTDSYNMGVGKSLFSLKLNHYPKDKKEMIDIVNSTSFKLEVGQRIGIKTLTGGCYEGIREEDLK